MRTKTSSLPLLASSAVMIFVLTALLGACSPIPAPPPTATHVPDGASAPLSADTPAPLPEGAFDCTAVAEIPKVECEALATLYRGTDGDNWRRKSGWSATNTPCSWEGVTCGDGHVRELRLDQNRLSGSIPSELCSLTSVEIGIANTQIEPCE